MTRYGRLWLLCMSALSVVAADAQEAFAQIGQRPAQEYIDRMDRPDRVEGLKIDEVVERLELEPGDIVADIGSGSGVFSIPMARAIGSSGTLYAVDIDQEMIDFVVERARSEGLRNVVGVFGELDDPKLPVNTVDVIFLHRTLHMIEHRQAYLNAAAQYLKPDARIVIIERPPEVPGNWMWLRQSDVDTWLAALSFYPVDQFDLFEDRWFVSYQRPFGDSKLLR